MRGEYIERSAMDSVEYTFPDEASATIATNRIIQELGPIVEQEGNSISIRGHRVMVNRAAEVAEECGGEMGTAFIF